MIRSPWRRAGLALCGLLAACALHAAPADPIPEAAGGASTEVSVAQGRAVAVTANPHATAAALAMLQQGGSAIDSNDTAARLAGDDVRLEPVAVFAVGDQHGLVGHHAGRLQQQRVDGNAPVILRVGLCHGRPMNLGLEKLRKHLCGE